MRIALAQINPTVGDLAGNSARIVEAVEQAAEDAADLVVLPELCVVGYPPLDLLQRRGFIEATVDALEWLKANLPTGPAVLFGTPVRNLTGTGKAIHNAAVLIEHGEVKASTAKQLLPTYDVFDEYRYFEPGRICAPILWRDLRIGVHVCEDMWNNESGSPYHSYASRPVDELAAQGCDLFINISASPFAAGKVRERDEIIRSYCRRHRKPFLYVNQVGANTELIFDGHSSAFDAEGRLQLRAAGFQEDLVYWEPELEPIGTNQPDNVEQLREALVLGIRDYVEKTGIFDRVVVGLSGGIDSAVTCALATEAMGPNRVMGITMPSRYSTTGSVTDSEQLADNLGIELRHISIKPAVDAFSSMLEDLFAGTKPGVAEENIQARSRGVTLMAVCNKFDHLLLTTGNKSELATGYATLYGDMSGGLAVLSDVLKTEVYELARHMNERSADRLIPESTISKPPSAELRPDQTDQDSLPPYEQLDRVLRLYIEHGEPVHSIIEKTGFIPGMVREVIGLVDRAEYKRRQAAPGLRVSNKAFGIGRRLPIVMNFRPIRKPEPSAPTATVEENVT